MGSSSTSFTMRVPGLAGPALLERVLAALDAHLRASGWVQSATDADAERRLMVVCQREGGWVWIFDEASEGQAADALEGMAVQLSAAQPGAFVVGVQIIDGDVLQLWLAHEGSVVDRYDSWPNWANGRLPPRPRRDLRGREHSWTGLATTPDTAASLREVWDQPRLDASERARRIATILGWDAELAVSGFQTLSSGWRASSVELAVQRSTRPAANHTPARWGVIGGPARLVARVGERTTTTIVAHNTGGPLEGASVAIFGPALEQGLVSVDSVVVATNQVAHPASLAREADVVFAPVPALRLPAGHDEVAIALREAATPQQGLAAWLATRIEVRVSLVSEASGRAPLHVGLVPDANAELGQNSWTLELVIEDTG